MATLWKINLKNQQTKIVRGHVQMSSQFAMEKSFHMVLLWTTHSGLKTRMTCSKSSYGTNYFCMDWDDIWTWSLSCRGPVCVWGLYYIKLHFKYMLYLQRCWREQRRRERPNTIALCCCSRKQSSHSHFASIWCQCTSKGLSIVSHSYESLPTNSCQIAYHW